VARGIGHRGGREAGGEVTGPGTVSAGLLASAPMAGMASTIGERKGSWHGLCSVGSR
jgi:hypothetical protein